MGVDNRGLFCLVDVYDDEDLRQQSEEEEEEDLEMIMEEEGDDEDGDSTSSSNSSSRSGSSLDRGDDASNSYSSPSPSLSSSKPKGALFDLSGLVSNLPIKRGLSKFYQGKSQSFTSLARVTSLEDLAKKSNTYKARKVKACKSQRSPYYASPKSAISKKSSSFSCLTGKTMTTCFIANS